MRRLLALVLAHVTAAVIATVALAIRRRVVFEVPLTHSFTADRFLPHLLLGPFYAIDSLRRFLAGDGPTDMKRLTEALGYIVPFLVFYLVYTRLLVGRRVATGFTPVMDAPTSPPNDRR